MLTGGSRTVSTIPSVQRGTRPRTGKRSTSKKGGTFTVVKKDKSEDNEE